jgi:hypothetical protein
MVPRELTDAMFTAHVANLSVLKKWPAAEKLLDLAQSTWDAMLAAAPPAPIDTAAIRDELLALAERLNINNSTNYEFLVRELPSIASGLRTIAANIAAPKGCDQRRGTTTDEGVEE